MFCVLFVVLPFTYDCTTLLFCMINTEEAREIISARSSAGITEMRPLTESLGKIIRESVTAPMDLPQFDQSAMDGFALRYADLQNHSSFNIIGESSAGKPFDGNSKPGDAIRIFTGAALPDWADHIIVVEASTVIGTQCTFNDPGGIYGQHIRKKGSQISNNEVAVREGSRINPATIGFLYSLGFTMVKVNRSLKISILVTGNELRKPGQETKRGEIYESNSVMLEAACRSVHEPDVRTYHCPDNESELTEKVKQLLQTSDILIATGGVSAGDYDYTTKAFTNCNVTKHFHKIAQKPGKPMYYGTAGTTHVFGLPGNPAAALTCFYEYVLPCINSINGATQIQLPQITLPIKDQWSKKAGLANYLKGRISESGVELQPGQESFILKSFAESDCLIYIKQDRTEINSGEGAEVHLLPFH